MTRHRLSVFVFAALIGAFLLLPTLIIVPMSFNPGRNLQFPPEGLSLTWYRTLFETPMWRDAMATSAKVAFFTVIIATALGTAAALGLARWRSRATGALTALLLSPMIVPVVILGVGTFLLFSKWRITGTMSGLVLAHVVLALPFVIVSVMASARTLDPTLELAAAGLGANRWKTFRRVVLPLILPGVVSGALFAFITSWDEIVVAIFMTSPTLRTLPVVMWGQVRTNLDPSLAAAGTLLILISTLALVAVQLLRRGAR
ncbi:MAG: putative spermidine/putrescine transport system permease protein [Solirubrobacteraceae bacterium]|jgi:putative spermidine/putrescine transport system permease protein|nr:putative spermidine/putrescine transport system permease protein [Solirubrobacteraceae bacterium]